MITVQQAEKLILAEKEWAMARGRRENTWYFFHNHVYGCAAVARQIAESAGLNPRLAEISALLHDIGKIKEQEYRQFHGIIGYNMLKATDENVARACLVHTFPYNHLEPYEKCAPMFFNKKEDYDFVAQYLQQHPVTDYDLLVQLADDLSNAYGFVTLEQRAEEYAGRHNLPLGDCIKLLEPVKNIKCYFENKLGGDIYGLYSQIDTKGLFLPVG